MVQAPKLKNNTAIGEQRQVWPPESTVMTHWIMQGLWQLMWPDQSHLPRLLAAQELGPLEEPTVPSSMPPDKLLCNGPPEPPNPSPVETAFCHHTCGLHCGSLQAMLSSQPQRRMPHATCGDELKLGARRQPGGSSMCDVKRASSQPPQALFCGRWCGQECVQQLHQASFMLTRPNFGRPPERAGLCDPDLMGESFRAFDDLDLCSTVPWARPPELPSLPSDANMEDCNGCNRQTTRPRFWQPKDADAQGRQEEDTAACATLQTPETYMQPDVEHPTCPSPSSTSHYSSILHKPGTRSPSTSARFVTFTMDERKPQPARPFLPLTSKAKAAPKKRSSDSGVLWHLIPGS